MEATPGIHPRPKKTLETVAISLFLAAIVWIVFGQTLGFGFVNYDDDLNVFGSPQVTNGISLHGIVWAFTHIQAGRWTPLATISRQVDCQVFGLWAGGHHLTNVILHLFATILLFFLLKALTQFVWRSGFVAAVFAVHPLHVKNVAWVSERGELLCGVFFILALWAYARYARRPESWGRYTMVMLWFVLGLMSKPMILTLPFVLLLLDYWPLNRFGNVSPGRLFSEKIPFFLLSAVSCLVAYIVPQKETASDYFPAWLRAENAVVSYAIYLRQTVWPSGLAALYPNPTHAFPWWQVAGSLGLLCLISYMAFGLRHRVPPLFVGWLWFAGMLVPVIGNVGIGPNAHADHYMYLPQIGLSIAGTWILADWKSAQRHGRFVMTGVAGAVLCILLVISPHETSYWHDSLTLWTHTLECTRDNSIAHNNLGAALNEQGRTDEAIAQYREALRINPRYASAHNNLGLALAQEGHREEAIAQYNAALQIEPAFAGAHYNMGIVLFQQGRAQEAVNQYLQALQFNPAYAAAHNNLGNILLINGQTDAAIAHYNEALKINSNYVDARDDLGVALAQQGRTEEAMAQFRETVRINPTYAKAHANLAEILIQQQRVDEAIPEFRKALETEAGDVKTHSQLSHALMQKGRVDEAIAELEKALEIDPNNATVHYDLGVALMQKGKPKEAITRYEKALAITPGYIQAQNNLAWILATNPDESLRNGPMAVELALRAEQLSGGKDATVLDTLAAAYAEVGQFSEAITTAQRAVALAVTQGNLALAADVRNEIVLYQAGKPFRDTGH